MAAPWAAVGTAAGCGVKAQAEHAHGLGQLRGLLLERLCGGGTLLHQGRVLLGRAVQVRHRFAHLGNAVGLLGGGGADFGTRF